MQPSTDTKELEALEQRLTEAAARQPFFPLSPHWWQEQILSLATRDPEFRVRLLRFVDVLPTLRSAAAVADHVRQYFGDLPSAPVRAASGLSAQGPLRPVLSRVLRQGVLATARRFIAGATPDEAVSDLTDLAHQGSGATLHLLGEATLSEAEAQRYLELHQTMMETLEQQQQKLTPRGAQWEGVPAVNLSLKPSAFCAHFEPAAPDVVSAGLRARLRPLLRRAAQQGVFLHFDMEQYRYKDLIHHAFADLLLEEEFASYPHLGIVVQAYLRDAPQDIERLRELAKRRGCPFTVRLVKGAYWDEERVLARQNGWPVPVYEIKEDTDRSYDRCSEALLAAWPDLRPAFGTHNPHSAAQAASKARRAGLHAADSEFQMLYGMAEGLRKALDQEGYRTRIYVPVGDIIPGMGYLVRRLLENTSNWAWFHAAGSSQERRPRSAAARVREHAQLTEDGSFQNAPPARFHEASVREAMAAALDQVRKEFGATYPLRLAGAQVAERELSPVSEGDLLTGQAGSLRREATRRGETEVRYPAEPELLLGRVARATPQDAQQAVAAAQAAFPAWRDRPASERTALLRGAADLMEERRYQLAALMVYESAKPWREADGDVTEAIDYLRYYAAQAERLEAPQRLGRLPGEQNEYFYQGRGVAAIIAPWNFPLAILTGMTGAALAGGNTAVLKPSDFSPLIALQLTDVLREAGIPEEVVQCLTGRGREVGQALVDHPAVDIIAFTGSREVGLSILASAATIREGQRNVKRVIVEMGGKNAIIIDEDADLDLALADTVASAFGFAGQKCSACSRLILVGSAYDEALERLGHAVRSLVIGPPHDPATYVPPVIGRDAQERILKVIEAGKGYACLLVQGNVPGGSGYYVPPTVFTEVPLDSPLAREEIFGPVLSVFRAKDFTEALALANDSSYALTGGVFSRHPRHIQEASRGFRVGDLYINRKITGASVGRQPFGGHRMSGYGEQAGGPNYLRQFMESRVVTENTLRRGLAPEDEA